jgi:hypothetical protein
VAKNAQVVYLVLCGDWNEYSIQAAFTTREAAESYIRHLAGKRDPSYYDFFIEELQVIEGWIDGG